MVKESGYEEILVCDFTVSPLVYIVKWDSFSKKQQSE